MNNDIHNTIQHCINLLPGLRHLVDDCFVHIYGGFMRWIVGWKLTFPEKEPTLEEICSYLDTADVDLRIKSPSHFMCKNLKAVQEYVTKNGARMEFMGNGYGGLGEQWVPTEEEKIEPLTLERKSVWYGTYSIWYPHPLHPSSPDKRCLRYELTIFNTSTQGYFSDFSVNSLYHTDFNSTDFNSSPHTRYSINMYRDAPNIEGIVKDIQDKNLRYCDDQCNLSSYSTYLKRMWRARKLWKRGFRPRDEQSVESLRIGFKRIDKTEKDDEDEVAHILKDEESCSMPSVLDGEPTTIYPTKHEYQILTAEMLYSDPIIQELRECITKE